MSSRAVVVGVGARTSLGLDARSTGFSHRAGAAGMTQSALLDVDGEPATMCLLPTLDPLCTGVERAMHLALPALKEAVAEVPTLSQMRVKQISLVDAFLKTPRADGSRPASDLGTALARAGTSACSSVQAVDVFALGPASLGFALESTFQALDRGGFQAVLLCGVHTDYDPTRVLELSTAGRLFTRDHLDALIPGEGAAALVVVRRETAITHRLPILAEIQGVATGMESARPDNDESPFRAFALTSAVREALAARREHDLRTGWLLTDLSFELFRVHEFQTMSSRTQKLWCEPQLCDTPAQRMGYLGAATMPLHLVLAAEAWRRRWAPHPEAVSIAGSDAGERAAIAISRPQR